jgi:hypothetical protein
MQRAVVVGIGDAEELAETALGGPERLLQPEVPLAEGGGSVAARLVWLSAPLMPIRFG